MAIYPHLRCFAASKTHDFTDDLLGWWCSRFLSGGIMAENVSRKEALEKVAGLIEDVQFAMMTTVDADGTLHSRPMATQNPEEFDGTLFFLTNKNSHKVESCDNIPT